MVCKLDFEKACDMVGWDFLQYMLAPLGLGETWRSWIQSCVTSPDTPFSLMVPLKVFFIANGMS